MSWEPRGEGEGRKAETCIYRKRDRLDLNLKFQGRVQLCLVPPKVSSIIRTLIVCICSKGHLLYPLQI